MPARHEQIGERAVHEQAMSVLRQSAIAHLDKAKHSLNDPDRMLDPGSHFRFGAVFRRLHLIDNTAVAIAPIGEIAGFGRMLSDHRPLSAVGLITPYPGLITVQQIGHRAVSNISWRGPDCVDQLRATVYPQMRLHPEIPLIALL